MLAYTVLIGLATRRLCRLVAQDTILDSVRNRWLARYPVAPHQRQLRWYPASTDLAPYEGQHQIRGRLHGRRGWWVHFPPPSPRIDEFTGAMHLPVLTWDETHEGRPDTVQYPPRPQAWLGVLVTCPWCLSVWVAAAITAGVVQIGSIPMPGVVAAAAMWVAGVAAGLESHYTA